MVMTMFSAVKNIFTNLFPICVHLISFPLLIALARKSSKVLNRNGESRHFCLRSKAWRLSLLMMILAIGFSNILLITWEKFPMIHICWKFLSWMRSHFFSNAFFVFIEKIMFFPNGSLIMMNYNDWFSNVKPTSHSENKFYLVMIYYLF